MVVNSLSFSFSGKVFIPPLLLRTALLDKVFLVGSFSFSTFSISSHCLLVCQVSAQKSFTDRLMGVPLCVRNFFSLASLKIISLTLDSFIVMCLGEDFFGLNLFGNGNFANLRRHLNIQVHEA